VSSNNSACDSESLKMDRRTLPTVYSDDSVLDNSTAPTTPDGSLTFSPALQALKIQDALEAVDNGGRKDSGSLDTTLYSSGGVKNICCIGAGYVGARTLYFLLNES